MEKNESGLDTEQGKITIWIDFSEGSLFRCSRCGNEATDLGALRLRTASA